MKTYLVKIDRYVDAGVHAGPNDERIDVRIFQAESLEDLITQMTGRNKEEVCADYLEDGSGPADLLEWFKENNIQVTDSGSCEDDYYDGREVGLVTGELKPVPELYWSTGATKHLMGWETDEVEVLLKSWMRRHPAWREWLK